MTNQLPTTTTFRGHTYPLQWKTLGEIGTFVRGNGLQKKDFTNSGVGCIHYGQIYTHYGTSATQTKSFVSEELAKKLLAVEPGNLVIACTSENVEDVGKAVAWLGDCNVVTGGHSVVFRHHLNPKYVSYFFQTDSFFIQKKKYAYGAKVIDIKTEDLAKIVIPIPPVELQEQIVEILDRFEEYIAGLQDELAARREQYAYYRNRLLDFDTDRENIVWKALGEVVQIVSAPKKLNRKDYCIVGKYPIIDQGQDYIAGYSDIEEALLPDGEYVLFGDHTRIIKYFKGRFIQGADGLKIIKTDSSILPKFLFYSMKTLAIEDRGYNRHWTVVSPLVIPIPPLEEQERIVRMLDPFEELINDRNWGLPAEIAARREQYAYYRNRLLSFRE
ncbi:MAG: restriction endonuclease subunit S [Bacteroides sp.]|nr:restriction endonuclease subunit S [Bacteroides sp.]MCM1379042.1 restriction endonuclease subunit S [Bacteroides sp.]MCM1445740.1 restriction endonuclease subunit S [Prevotella sp.]